MDYRGLHSKLHRQRVRVRARLSRTARAGACNFPILKAHPPLLRDTNCCLSFPTSPAGMVCCECLHYGNLITTIMVARRADAASLRGEWYCLRQTTANRRCKEPGVVDRRYVQIIHVRPQTLFDAK